MRQDLGLINLWVLTILGGPLKNPPWMRENSLNRLQDFSLLHFLAHTHTHNHTEKERERDLVGVGVCVCVCAKETLCDGHFSIHAGLFKMLTCSDVES